MKTALARCIWAFCAQYLRALVIVSTAALASGCLVQDKSIQFTSKIGSSAKTTPTYYIDYGSTVKTYQTGVFISDLPNTNLTAPTYSVSPALPASLSFNSANGEITGMPSVVITGQQYTISATDANAQTASVVLTISTGSNVLSLSPTIISADITTDSLRAYANYTGDINSNATCMLYMCNNDIFPSCDPSAMGPFLAMSRIGNTFSGTFSNMRATYTAHNIGPMSNLNLEVVCNDPDGANNGNFTGSAQLAPQPELTVSAVNVSNVTYNSFLVTATVSGDIETTSDAACTIYYCNETDVPGCNPFAGSTLGMNRSGTSTTNTISLLPPNDPLDSIAIRVNCTDPDGVSGVVPFATSVTLAAAPPATQIFRSVGQFNTTDIASGNPSTLTIAGNTATFSATMPSFMGVGDVIQYDSDSNGTVDSVAFIHGRNSNSSYTVASAVGGTPLAVTNDMDWRVYRAYSSLSDAVNGTENLGINPSVSNFDTFSVGKDISIYSGSNHVWNIAVYSDAAVSGGTTISSIWHTSASNYIRIFAPYLPSEVGSSQRHSGVWSNFASRIAIATPSTHPIWISGTGHVKIEGMQIMHSYNGPSSQRGIYISGASVQRVSLINNLISNLGSHCVDMDSSVPILNPAFRLVALNNILFDCGTAPLASGDGIRGYGYAYLYNNTAFHIAGAGIRNMNVGGVQWNLKNNLVQDTSTPGYMFSSPGSDFDAASDRNISSDSSSPNAAYRNVNLTFVDHIGMPYNLHLSSGDSAAIGQGLDLSSDPIAPFAFDLDGETRSGAWDIGADESPF